MKILNLLKFLNSFKNLFKSKRKKLILDIKKKHNKNIDQEYINDYRRKEREYPDTHSDNDILELILCSSGTSKTTKTTRESGFDNYSSTSSHSYSSCDSSCSSSSSCD